MPTLINFLLNLSLMDVLVTALILSCLVWLGLFVMAWRNTVEVSSQDPSA